PDETAAQRRRAGGPREAGLTAPKTARDEQDDIVKVGVVVQPGDPRRVGWAGIRRRHQRQRRHDEEETQNASTHHVLKIISRSPCAARSFTSVGSLHYVAATLGVVARSLGAPHAGAESAGP